MMWFLNDDILRNLPSAVHEQCHAKGMAYLTGGVIQNKFYLGEGKTIFYIGAVNNWELFDSSVHVLLQTVEAEVQRNE